MPTDPRSFYGYAHVYESVSCTSTTKLSFTREINFVKNYFVLFLCTSNVTFVLYFQADNPPPTGPKIVKKVKNDNTIKKASDKSKSKKYNSKDGSGDENKNNNKNENENENENDITWMKNKITIKKTTKFGCFATLT